MKPSGTYRLGRAFRLLASLALVALILFLVSVVVSAVQVGQGVQSQTGRTHTAVAAQLVGTNLEVSLTFPITNRGFYEIEGLRLASQFTDTTLQTGSLAVAQGGPITIPGGATKNLTLMAKFNLSGPAGSYLLVNDALIGEKLWLNATYANLVPVGVGYDSSYQWGAPLYHLAFSLGVPSLAGNGTVAAPVTITFENHAQGLTLVGTLRSAVVAPNGTVCASASFPVLAPPGPNTLGGTIYVLASCPIHGDTVVGSFLTAGIAFPFPPETIP